MGRENIPAVMVQLAMDTMPMAEARNSVSDRAINVDA